MVDVDMVELVDGCCCVDGVCAVESTYSLSNISHCVVWFLMTSVQSQAELRRGND